MDLEYSEILLEAKVLSTSAKIYNIDNSIIEKTKSIIQKHKSGEELNTHETARLAIKWIDNVNWLGYIGDVAYTSTKIASDFANTDRPDKTRPFAIRYGVLVVHALIQILSSVGLTKKLQKTYIEDLTACKIALENTKKKVKGNPDAVEEIDKLIAKINNRLKQYREKKVGK